MIHEFIIFNLAWRRSLSLFLCLYFSLIDFKASSLRLKSFCQIYNDQTVKGPV